MIETSPPPGLVVERHEPESNKHKMKYQFDNPPTREGIIHEFGINPEQLHNIEVSIRYAAEMNGDDIDWSKDKFTAGEQAYYLARCKLVESFAMLCCLSHTGSLVCLTDVAFLGVWHIKAQFDKVGHLMRWGELKSIGADDWLEWGALAEDTTDCIAVSRCPLSEVQWRRKFVSERWYYPHLKPSERLVDSDDLADWNALINGGCISVLE